jgi:hypothetical protein
MSSPLMQFQSGGQTAIVSYNVPEPSIYYGERVVALDFQAQFGPAVDIFVPLTQQYVPPPDSALTLPNLTRAMMAGFADPTLFPALGVPPNTFQWVVNDGWIATPPYTGIWKTALYSVEFAAVYFQQSTTPSLRSLTPEEVLSQLKKGYRLTIYANESGQWDRWWVPFSGPQKRLVLLEKYGLSTYAGSYGAGRTIKTFSLLPGEKTKITLKTYTRSTIDTKATSSILDSVTNEGASEFQSAMEAEETDKQNQANSHAWHVEAQAETDWGFVQAKVQAGYNGSTNAAREQFARNTNNALQKHAAKASSQRDIKVEQSSETKTETGEESALERELQNINVGRTLNFVFRQLNQEYITILHLLDVQLGFDSGDSQVGVKRYTLTEIDTLLNAHVKPEFQEAVRHLIVDDALSNIFDYQGKQHVFVERRVVDTTPLEPAPTVLPAASNGAMGDQGRSAGTTTPPIVVSHAEAI